MAYKTPQKTVDSLPSIDRFKVLASLFTSKAIASKKAALTVLKHEGILNTKGNLSKNYSVK